MFPAPSLPSHSPYNTHMPTPLDSQNLEQSARAKAHHHAAPCPALNLHTPLTRTLLMQNPDKMAKAQAEIDAVMGARDMPTMADFQALRYVMRWVGSLLCGRC